MNNSKRLPMFFYVTKMCSRKVKAILVGHRVFNIKLIPQILSLSSYDVTRKDSQDALNRSHRMLLKSGYCQVELEDQQK